MEDYDANRQRYLKIANDLGELLAIKNKAYGSSFVRGCEILRTLYPNGVGVDQFPDMLAIIRVVDKMFRIANNRDAFGESPWRDIAGYAILATDFHENRRHEYFGESTAKTLVGRERGKYDHAIALGLSDDEARATACAEEPDTPLATCTVCCTRHDNPIITGLCDELALARNKFDTIRQPPRLICPVCVHDHGRPSSVPFASCLRVVDSSGDGPGVCCGCTGPGEEISSTSPLELDVPAAGMLSRCEKCHAQTVKNGTCLICSIPSPAQPAEVPHTSFEKGAVRDDN